MYSAVWGRKHEIGDGLIVLAQILVGEGAQLLQRDFPHEFLSHRSPALLRDLSRAVQNLAQTLFAARHLPWRGNRQEQPYF
jgi:hypothetical protein